MLDTLAKKSQSPKARTFPQPKRPAPASTPLVSFKKPKQNPQPSGRGRGKFQGKGQNFSGQSAHRGKGRGAKRLSKFSGAWSEIGADPWVMRIVQWGYRIPFVTLPPLKLQLPEPVSAGAAEQGSDRASSTLPGLLQPIVPCPQGNRGVEADHRSVLPQCLRALPELHYGDASVNPQGPSAGPVVNLPRPERCLLSYRDPPIRQTLPILRFCHNGTAWQFTVLPFGLSTSPRVFTKILKPVLAYAHLHQVKLHMYLDDWLLNPGTHQEALEQYPGSSPCAKS